MGLINYVTRIHFGFGETAQLGAELRLASIARPLIVTDKGVRQLGFLERLEGLLDAAPAGVFDDTPGNPNEAAVRAATDMFHAAGADGIVAIGGGSAIDLAKGVAILAAHGGSLKSRAGSIGSRRRPGPPSRSPPPRVPGARSAAAPSSFSTTAAKWGCCHRTWCRARRSWTLSSRSPCHPC
jgi:alcohol dehydrogenase class IV